MMRRASVLLFAPVLVLSSLIVACGDDGGGDGDDEGDGTPRAGTSASGGLSGTAGAGGTSVSGSGGSSTTAGAGGKSSSSGNVTGSTKLSEIDTPAEAQAACERVASSINEGDLNTMLEGLCTMTGMLAAFQGADCEQSKAACLADASDPIEDCSADDIPDCDVSLDEYLACTNAQVTVTAALFKNITCESDITSLPLEPPETPAACVSVYAACPELDPTVD